MVARHARAPPADRRSHASLPGQSGRPDEPVRKMLDLGPHRGNTQGRDCRMLTNAQIAELLARASEEAEPGSHRGRALGRASRAAFFWPVEAARLLQQDRPLTELRSVGPWLAGVITGWLLDPMIEPPDPPELRRGYLTMSEVRQTIECQPDWIPALRADLQMHITWSDGAAPLREVVDEAEALWNYEFIAITDHSKGLKIAGGMDEGRLAEQGEVISRVNQALGARGSRLRVLRSI